MFGVESGTPPTKVLSGTVTKPRVTAVAQGPQTADVPVARPRVLVVEDDRFMLATLDRILTDASIEVVAGNAKDGLRSIEDQDFDLIICDRTMPGISGQEFLHVVRSKPRLDLTPFVFLTASLDIDDMVTGLRAGADDYITKPFTPDELVARVTSRLERSQNARRRDHHIVDVETFVFAVERELAHVRRGGDGAVLAIVDIPSLQAVQSTLGGRERRRVLEEIATAMQPSAEPLDVIGVTRYGELAILMPATAGRQAADRLRAMAMDAAALVTETHGHKVRTVPVIGYAEARSGSIESTHDVFQRAVEAAEEAMRTQDLQPRRWIPLVEPTDSPKSDRRPRRDIAQVGSTFGIGIVLPFLLYFGLDRLGLDVSWPVYIAVVLGLVSTATLIWTEGFFALRHPGAPTEAGEPEPSASAIICAYMPNEADTIVETIEHFLGLEYEAGLQIILAYNTPRDLPVEDELREIASLHPELLLLKVEGSDSKAQNLNAALARATGEFVGVFDADHQPDPGSFQRAWRWLSNDYDVVQGHCLVRNPDETFLSRMVAVEFETIYSVSHPGRWMRDGFGIFGGSNGYWRTDALHLTRMRGSMLTEDIDASMRVLVAGGKIASDPGLISRELATTTAKQIWYQRLRWAQGWTQVSIRHLWQMMRLAHFSPRQKFGVFMLLFQRELYPWLSLQIFPLVAFWWIRGDALDWFVPIFVAATIFATSVGPGMTAVAYRLSHPSIKRRSWFLQYGAFSTLLYTEAKNIIARVAHIKEAMGESSWRVTPRTADPGKGNTDTLEATPTRPPSPPDAEPSASTRPLAMAGPPPRRFETWDADTTNRNWELTSRSFEDALATLEAMQKLTVCATCDVIHPVGGEVGSACVPEPSHAISYR